MCNTSTELLLRFTLQYLKNRLKASPIGQSISVCPTGCPLLSRPRSLLFPIRRAPAVSSSCAFQLCQRALAFHSNASQSLRLRHLLSHSTLWQEVNILAPCRLLGYLNVVNPNHRERLNRITKVLQSTKTALQRVTRNGKTVEASDSHPIVIIMILGVVNMWPAVTGTRSWFLVVRVCSAN